MRNPQALFPLRIVSPAGVTALLGAFALAGCAAVPGSNLARQDTTELAADESFASDGAARWPGEGWWRDFGDQQLAALVEEGLDGSPGLDAAEARVRRASALAAQAGAALLPSVDAAGSIGWEKRSYNNGFPKEFLPQGWLDNAQASLTLGFDPDLWGRNRAGLAAVTSQARAAQMEARQARLTLATTIASAYSDLARQFDERDIRAAALDLRLASHKLVAAKYEGGLETRGNLRQAEAAVATARASLAASDQAIALRRHQIAALLGKGPDRGLAIDRPASAERAVTGGLPDGATTELLARRPDIAAARARVESAASRIRVARADFFPAIRLDALIGLQALGVNNLLESDSTFGSVGPAISLPIFRGGALKGRYRQAEAEFDEARADYQGTVVDAYREVADAVATQDAVRRRRAHSADALEVSEEAYAIARLRYEGGLSSYLDVLAVEDRLLEARLAKVSIDGAARASDIALIRALGGGFVAEGISESTQAAVRAARERNLAGG